MKAVIAFLALLTAGVLTAPAAEAALRVCNTQEDGVRTVALGYRDGPEWVSEGWWNIKPGDCAVVLGGDLKKRYYHYYENRPGFVGDPASRDLCVELSKFSVTGQDNCDPATHSVVRFKRIDVGGKVQDFEYDLPEPLQETSMEKSILWYGSVAKEAAPFGNTGGNGAWNVHIAQNLEGNRACFAYKVFPDGTVFRVGLDPWKPERYLFAFGNTEWASIARDQDYELEVRVVGRANWTIGATGRSPAPGWAAFLVHRSSGTKFVEDFRLGNTMELTYNNSRIARLSLSGTTNALARIQQCQDAEGVTTSKPKTGNSKDPFAD